MRSRSPAQKLLVPLVAPCFSGYAGVISSGTLLLFFIRVAGGVARQQTLSSFVPHRSSRRPLSREQESEVLVPPKEGPPMLTRGLFMEKPFTGP